MVNDARDTAREAGSGFIETMKQNPLPTALAAIGIGWLFMQSRNNQPNKYRYANSSAYPRNRYEYERYDYNRPTRYYEQPGRGGGPGQALDRAGNRIGEAAGQVGDTVSDKASDVTRAVSDAAGQVKDKAGNVVSRMGDTAGDAVDNVQDKMGEVGNTVQYQAQQAQGQFQRMLYENPLTVGAAALVIGAAVGGLLPQTEQENRLMGDARDNVLDKAQSLASEAANKVSNVAQGATDAARQQAQQEGLTT